MTYSDPLLYLLCNCQLGKMFLFFSCHQTLCLPSATSPISVTPNSIISKLLQPPFLPYIYTSVVCSMSTRMQRSEWFKFTRGSVHSVVTSSVWHILRAQSSHWQTGETGIKNTLIPAICVGVWFMRSFSYSNVALTGQHLCTILQRCWPAKQTNTFIKSCSAWAMTRSSNVNNGEQVWLLLPEIWRFTRLLLKITDRKWETVHVPQGCTSAYGLHTGKQWKAKDGLQLLTCNIKTTDYSLRLI